MEVLVAADLLNLPRLVQLAEIALQPVFARCLDLAGCIFRSHIFYFKVIDSGNAVPVYLAAEAHGAKQLMAICEHCMAADVEEAERHEQWGELKAETREKLKRASVRMQEERERQKRTQAVMKDMPCLFAKAAPV